MKLTKARTLTMSAATAGVALSGLGMVGASSASADIPGHVIAEHFPGSYWTSKAACQPYADAYVKKVKAAGYYAMDETALDQDVQCKIFDKGWSYVVQYQADDPTKAVLLAGDFYNMEPSASDRKAPKVDANGQKMQSWAKAARVTHWYHFSPDFTSKTACNASLAPAQAKLNAAIKAGKAVPLYLLGVGSTCNNIYDPKVWQFDAMTYNAGSKANLFAGDTWQTMDATDNLISTGDAKTVGTN